MVKELRKQLKTIFSQHNIDIVDADYIISYCLGVGVTELFFQKSITKKQLKQINKMVKIRLKGKPINKIIKRAYFYNLEFEIDKNVLAPRQDSELVVDVALKYINNGDNVLDLCTGSGCLAVALKKNSEINITASDISNSALKIAKKNAQSNNAEINFIQSNMFDKIKGGFNVIVSNPPYIQTEEIKLLDKEVKLYDPIIALDGGKDGLRFYKIIKENIKNYLLKDGFLILEIGDTQKSEVIEIFSNLTFIESIKDYGNKDRVLVFKNE